MTVATARYSTARIIAAISTMFLPLAAVLGSFLLWRDRLPPELASHWSGTGAWPGLRSATRRGGFLIAGFAAGAAAQTWLVSAYLTMQAGDPYEVVQGAWSFLGFVAIGYGLIPFFIAPKPQLISHDATERIDLNPGENGAWSRTTTAKLFLWTALALIALEITIYTVAAANGSSADAVLGLLVGGAVIVVLVALSRYRVTADWRGLQVVSSLLRIPLKRIRLEDISTVESAQLLPGQWGGWGYRITPGRSALILRKGPGLIVTMTNTKLATLRDQSLPATATTPGAGT
jgi:hypothetical protein